MVGKFHDPRDCVDDHRFIDLGAYDQAYVAVGVRKGKAKRGHVL